MNMTVLCDVSSSLIKIDRSFRDAYYLRHQSPEAVSASETSISFYETTP